MKNISSTVDIGTQVALVDITKTHNIYILNGFASAVVGV